MHGFQNLLAHGLGPSGGLLVSTRGPSLLLVIGAASFTSATAVWTVLGGVSGGSFLVRCEVVVNTY